jgi:hypothetical protein
LLEQPKTEWKKLRSPPVSEKAEVADAHETARQQVEQEATQELFDRQSHEPLLVLENQFRGFLISENCFYHTAVHPQRRTIGVVAEESSLAT